MTIFHKLIYKNKIGNINYWEAIAKYNKHVRIEEINGWCLPESRECSSLPDLLKAHMNSDEVEIKCISGDELSTIDIFPKVDHIDLLKLAGIKKNEVTALLKPVNNELNIIRRKLNFDLLRGPRDITISLPPIKKINKLQALLFLNIIREEFEISGAMHFEDINTILFQSNCKNRLLTYDEYSQFKDQSFIRFDVDDGFKTENKKIATVLQNFFEVWRSNNYHDSLIPVKYSGFNSIYPIEVVALDNAEKQDISIKEDNSTFGKKPKINDQVAWTNTLFNKKLMFSETMNGVSDKLDEKKASKNDFSL